MNPLQKALSQLPDGLNKKQAAKVLKMIANAMPKSVYMGKKIIKQHVHDLTAKEIKNTMFQTEPQNLISTEGTDIMRKVDAYYFTNHERRLRKAYESEGRKGVIKYIRSVDTTNKAVNEAAKTTAAMVGISRIVKEKIQPIL
jgi:hypothetical protein